MIVLFKIRKTKRFSISDFTFLVILLSIEVYAQEYSTSTIPDSLKEVANCVIREFSKKIVLTSYNKNVTSIKKVITILDKDEDNKALLAIDYDKNSEVNINQIIIYDGNGKKIRKVKQSEIIDLPAFDDYVLYSDNRTKFFRPQSPEYPYSIEYNYEIISNKNVSYGSWRPITDYNIAVEHATLSLKYPPNMTINKKEVNFRGKYKEDLINKMVVQSWEINAFKAIEDELLDVSLSERTPCIYIMPSELIYDDYRGSAGNWVEYGAWIKKLYNGKDELPESAKLKVTTLLKDISDTLECIKILYSYLQENTRYVAVFLGIGGYRPFSAKTVFETGYGDCKALSNYMYSLLKFIGVKSYPALVSSGRYIEPIFNDFPNFQQFNHVILCVPLTKDTIWLECTSQKIPFGFLGDYTDDRDVLLLTDNGGKFAHTKKYNDSDNVRIGSAYINIDSTGAAECSIKTSYRGLQYNDISELLYANYEDQKKWLYKNTTLPSNHINNYSIIIDKKDIPIATLNESVFSKNYCSFSGKYMLLPLNLINAQKAIQKTLKPRRSDIFIGRSSIDYDTIVFKIPNQYNFEPVPLGKTINSDYGNYSYAVSAAGNKITYIRKLLINKGRYKPTEYNKFYQFILLISKADNIKIILTKKL